MRSPGPDDPLLFEYVSPSIVAELAEPDTIDWDAGVVGHGVDDIPASAETITGRGSLIDGDTIEIHGKRIRILDHRRAREPAACTRPDGSE